MPFTYVNTSYLLILLLFPSLISLVSYFLTILSKGGAVAVFFITLGASLGLGLKGVLYVFFILYSASLVTIYGTRTRGNHRFVNKGREVRDFWRIIGGGGAGGLVSWLAFLEVLPIHLASIGLVVALGITNSDTWASGFGILSRNEPRMILPPWNRVNFGVSGAISTLGELFAILGAITGVGTGYLLGLLPKNNIVIIALSLAVIIAGEHVDSVLGASAQESYFCPKCNSVTDRRTHECGTETVFKRGNHFVTNSGVNFISSSIGTIAILFLIIMLH